MRKIGKLNKFIKQKGLLSKVKSNDDQMKCETNATKQKKWIRQKHNWHRFSPTDSVVGGNISISKKKKKSFPQYSAINRLLSLDIFGD